jgi:hypothetical protein
MSVFGCNLQARLFHAKKQHVLQPCANVKNGVRVFDKYLKMTKLTILGSFLTPF